MAILEILRFPDPRLRTKAKPVQQFDEKLKTIVDNMYETMYESDGVGLAATQVNIHKRILVMDTSKTRDEPICLINPEIVESEGKEVHEEGCLSVPEYYAKVTRAQTVKVKAVDVDNQPIELEAEELLSVCVQHEIDHLDGKLFVDYLSPLKQQMVRKKMQKLAKGSD